MKTIVRKPIDLLEFVTIEQKQFLIALANNTDEMKLLAHVQGLYVAANSAVEADENDMVVFQMLAFTHYHFLFSTSAMMRCHLSESFSSVRVAIDAALIAAKIIKDRASQVAYMKSEHPFGGGLNKHYRKLINEKKELPHSHIPDLLTLHEKCSSFASHADIDSFAHRASFDEIEGTKTLLVQYFQFSKDEREWKIHFLSILHAFVMILDVFADFLINEQKLLPVAWHQELQGVGRVIEQKHKALSELLAKDAEGTVKKA